MPIREYQCRTCGRRIERVEFMGDGPPVCCETTPARLPSAAWMIVPGNIGPKLRNRVALDDELKKQGIKSDLFRTEEIKEQSRWALKHV